MIPLLGTSNVVTAGVLHCNLVLHLAAKGGPRRQPSYRVVDDGDQGEESSPKSRPTAVLTKSKERVRSPPLLVKDFRPLDVGTLQP